MTRIFVIRSAGIAISAIAASVLAAQHFMGGTQTADRSGAVTDRVEAVVGASLVSGSGRTDNAPEAPPPAEAPQLQLSALDDTPQDDGASAPTADFQPDLVLSSDEGAGTADACAATLDAAPAIDGLIQLRLDAPCNADERIVVSHGDLAFSAMTGPDGGYSGYIPALAAQASVDVFMADDTYLQAQAEVPDYNSYARVIVQWNGPNVMDLHAFHGGAGHDEPGHVHVASPFDPALEEAFLIALGTEAGPEPMLAQVYSVPAAQAGNVRLSLEVESDSRVCGQDMTGYILRAGPGARDTVEELGVAMPGCDDPDGLVILQLPAISGPVAAARSGAADAEPS